MFQFQTGSIKSADSYMNLRNIARFNSKLVRLKAPYN